MTETTALDAAHAAMQAAPQDDTARLRFFERLADSELFLMLTEEAQDENISPELFDVADGRFVLVFDLEERMAEFAGCPVPYVALSGRVLSGMLSGQGVGLGLNLETAPSSMLIPAEALGWLSSTLQHGPQEVRQRLAEFHPPTGLPDNLLTALDAKLATAAGLASAAFLVGTKTEDGGRGHLLGFVSAVEDAQSALARAVSEALTFSGIEAGALDVGFFEADEPAATALAKAGLRFDLPQPQKPHIERVAPGSDPERPPILK
ncbi:SseB protein N-terminal domain-containing protein [Ruegeria halocynthiae]|uniref:SseB protein N-terminal domain-containing protein n=1 Tax=Ruegeria halocynthiae TaxID=985054 RepID=A0A1H2VJJ2_9RHOB|nr:SseB family protein [Ruegeria halocynthiae]SDW68575.1 SseB protein N-terminal domain-containing protein [Ruegeria halocynthiae]